MALNIAFIGHGAIASSALILLRADPGGVEVSGCICRPGREQAAAAVFGDGVPVATSIDELPDSTDLVVDCAGHGGLQQHAEPALLRGFDVLTVSIGALTDPDLLSRLIDAAGRGSSRLNLASGAIGALDALSAAAVGGLDEVVYRGRKSPQAWQGSVAEETLDLSGPLPEPVCHFAGTAGEAASRYPKNANVAAAVALAGVGFDDTTVELWADSGFERSTHTIDATGRFGKLHFEIAGEPMDDSPRSSALTAMSVVAQIRRLISPLGF